MSNNTRCELLPVCVVFVVTSFLSSCATTQPRTADNYLASRQLVTMSDEEQNRQCPSSIVSRQTTSNETVIKKGKIQKQESEVTELVETDITTVIDTSSAPTSDQDLQ